MIDTPVHPEAYTRGLLPYPRPHPPLRFALFSESLSEAPESASQDNRGGAISGPFPGAVSLRVGVSQGGGSDAGNDVALSAQRRRLSALVEAVSAAGVRVLGCQARVSKIC